MCQAIKKINAVIQNQSTALNLGGLGLEEIPSRITELKQLKKLWLHSNNLKEIRHINQLPSLQELYLYDNQIEEIKGLENLPALTKIDLSDNQISELPHSILDKGLPIFWSLPKDENDSKGIYLKNNPCKTPPPEIIRRGNDAIGTYFKELDKSDRLLNEVKVILIGDGGAGKTSVVRRLLGQGFDPEEKQTHGIKISDEIFPIESNDLKVNFWDFGGQEIMHSTHQFFLTKRCLYLLVLDSRKDEKAEYWLKYVRSFGGDSPVLIVINKTDENAVFDLNRKFLNQKYSNIKGYYHVSCKEEKNSGLQSLKTDLLEYLWNLELREAVFPANWFKVKDYFQEMRQDYISYPEYQNICKENGVYELDSQNILLGFLNDLGIIFKALC